MEQFTNRLSCCFSELRLSIVFGGIPFTTDTFWEQSFEVLALYKRSITVDLSSGVKARFPHFIKSVSIIPMLRLVQLVAVGSCHTTIQ